MLLFYIQLCKEQKIAPVHNSSNQFFSLKMLVDIEVIHVIFLYFYTNVLRGSSIFIFIIIFDWFIFILISYRLLYIVFDCDSSSPTKIFLQLTYHSSYTLTKINDMQNHCRTFDFPASSTALVQINHHFLSCIRFWISLRSFHLTSIISNSPKNVFGSNEILLPIYETGVGIVG